MKFPWIAVMPMLAFTVHAQDAPVALSLDACISQALDQNPSLQASRAKVDAADARASETTTALLPQLKLTGRAAELSDVPAYSLTLPGIGTKTIFPSITENYSVRLTLQQPVFTGLKLLKTREMASLNSGATQQDFNKDRADLILNVTTAYWNLYRAVKVEEVIRQSVEQISGHLRDVKNMSSQGLATDADVMKVQVQYSQMKVRHIEARNSIRIASMALNSILGNPIDRSVVPSDSPAVAAGAVPVREDLHDLQSRAQSQRPELKSLELRRDMNSAGVSAARAGWYPQVSLAANYDYARPNQRILPPVNQWNNTWDVGLNLQWNIWDWYATGHQTAQAEAALRQTEAGLTQMKDAVMLDVARQYYDVQTSQEEVGVAAEGVQQARESYRITSDKFHAGVASNTDLLDAENAFLQAGLTYTQAVVDCTLALAHLKNAVGDGN